MNTILEKNGITDKLSDDDIEFTDLFLWNKRYYTRNHKAKDVLQLRRRKLSEIVFNHYYKRPENTTFYHYTSFANFESIIKNQELWLFNLTKRFNEGEFRTFYSDHGLNGYEINKDDKGEIMSRSIMNQTFYISFTNASTIPFLDEEDLWYSFGDKGLGVRIEFEINTNHPDFRSVYYKSTDLKPESLLLNQLTEEVKNKYSRIFAIAGLSKIGGFYLQGDFSTEHESRLLFKEFTEEYDFNFNPITYNGDIKYIKLKFNNSFANIKVLSIQPGFKIHDNRVEETLNLYPLHYTPKIIEKPFFK